MFNKFKYFKEKHIIWLILIGILFFNLLVVVLGCFILRLLPENQGMSMSDSLWESLKLLMDPGGFLGSKLSAVTTVATMIIVLCGMITLSGGVISYINNVFTDMIEKSKDGKRELRFYNQTLILNWNDRAMSIVLDYVRDARRNNKKEYIVILCDEDKQELEQAIEKEMKAYQFRLASYNKHKPRIIVKNGDPTQSTDLLNVSYPIAKQIFVMRNEKLEDPDFGVMQVCMNISASNSMYNAATGAEVVEENDSWRHITVVAEVAGKKTAKMLRDFRMAPIYDGKDTTAFTVSTISTDFALGKILAQIAMQPSMSEAINEILSFSGSEFVNEMVGEDDSFFGDFRKELETLKYSIPIYDELTNGKLHSRLYLSSNSSRERWEFEEVDDEKKRVELKGKAYKPFFNSDKKHIVIWGYNEKLRYILSSIQSTNDYYSYSNYYVSLVGTEAQKDDLLQVYQEYGKLIKDEPIIVPEAYIFDSYEKVFTKELITFLILAEDGKQSDSIDRQVLEVWMGIQKALLFNKDMACLLNGRMVFEVSTLKNAEILRQSEEQIVVSSRLSSLFMGQMASGSEIKDVLFDLISVEGDKDFDEHEIETKGVCDLQAISVKDFFETADDVEFLSKQDLVCNVFDGTDGEYIPLGIISDGSVFMLTNGGKDSKKIVKGEYNCIPNMTDGILIEGDGEGMYYMFQDYDYAKGLKIRPNDYLFVAHRVNGANVDIEYRYI